MENRWLSKLDFRYKRTGRLLNLKNAS